MPLSGELRQLAVLHRAAASVRRLGEFPYLRPRTPVFRVPHDLPSEVAVLTEIFAVTHSLERVAAIRRPGGFLPGDTVAVVGVGSLGMAHLVKAALMGAR